MIETGGYVFGFIDNGVLAVCAVKGIDLDARFNYGKVNGALYGALFGNSLSDFIGAVIDFGVPVALQITIGCLIVIPFVKLYYYIKEWGQAD